MSELLDSNAKTLVVERKDWRRREHESRNCYPSQRHGTDSLPAVVLAEKGYDILGVYGEEGTDIHA
jgi:hypothetical protein